MKTIEGGIEKVFLMINSANYNNDGKYCIHIGNLAEMVELEMNTSEDSSDEAATEFCSASFELE